MAAIFLPSFGLNAAPPAPGNGELPLPRVLPQELQPRSPSCPRPANARCTQGDSSADEAQGPRLLEAIDQLRQERERLRQVRSSGRKPAVDQRQPGELSLPADSADPPDAVQRQVQQLLLQWILHGAAPTAPQRTSSSPAATRAPPPGTLLQPGLAVEPTFPTSASPTETANDKPSLRTAPSGNAAPPNPIESRSPQAPATNSLTASSRANSSATTASDKPLAPMELAQVLFRAGNYEGALAAFQLLDTTQLTREDRLLVQYLQASCLRKLGREEEATRLLREIANSRTDSFAVECARWQLSIWRWQQDTQRRLTQLRSERENTEPQR